MNIALSINGGGLRGVIPCAVLARLEKETGKPCREIFRYIAGTSTGALLAGGLAAGVPAATMMQFYTGDAAKKIFNPPSPFSDVERAVRGFAYDPAVLRDVLVQAYGKVACGWRMNDSPVRMMVVAVAANQKPWFFVRDNPRNSGTTGDKPMLDACVASACAPTYFSPWPITVDGRVQQFFDGGSGAWGNPVGRMAIEMFDYDDGGFTPQNTRIVRLGTGFYPAGDEPPQGIIATIGWATDTLLGASEDEQDGLVRRFYYRANPQDFLAFNWKMPRAIDMADLSGVPELVTVANQAAASTDLKGLLAL